MATDRFLALSTGECQRRLFAAGERATTFWSGCGAVRRSLFLDMGGFDESYARPCIEDIELGARLTRSGHAIVLRKSMQVTHLKKWTFWSMLKSDIWDRAVPWTNLVLREGKLPVSFEVVYGHAWRAPARRKRNQTEDGRAIVQFQRRR